MRILKSLIKSPEQAEGIVGPRVEGAVAQCRSCAPPVIYIVEVSYDRTVQGLSVERILLLRISPPCRIMLLPMQEL